MAVSFIIIIIICTVIRDLQLDTYSRNQLENEEIEPLAICFQPFVLDFVSYKFYAVNFYDFIWSIPSGTKLTQVKEEFPLRAVKEAEILRELRNVKWKKATGLGNLPSGLLKDAAEVITKPLTFIINLSLATEVVPTKWKVTKVICLFKTGALAEIDNYRWISILPTLLKVLVRRVYKQVMKQLECNGHLSEDQFGYRSYHSTELAVTLFTDLI